MTGQLATQLTYLGIGHGAKTTKMAKSSDEHRHVNPAPKYEPEVYIDDVCTDYCDGYFKTCATNNIFLNPDMAMEIKGSQSKRGREGNLRRNLQDFVPLEGEVIAKVISEEPKVERSPNLVSIPEGIDMCRKQCMKFPRG